MTDPDNTKEAPNPATDDFAEFCHTAERTIITVSPEAYAAFVKLLDTPPKPNARLRALMNTKAPWDLPQSVEEPPDTP